VTEAEPKYFRCDVTIFVKVLSHNDIGVLNVGPYIGSKIAGLVIDTNDQHANLGSGNKMVLEAGDITTAVKDKRPRGRFKDG